MNFESLKELLPKGPATSLSLLIASLFLFNLGSESNTNEWFKVITAVSGIITLLVVLLNFDLTNNSKEHNEKASAVFNLIYPRDLGFLAGLSLQFSLIYLIDKSYIPLLKDQWHSLSFYRYFVIISFSIPSIIHNGTKKLLFSKVDNHLNQNVLFFSLGYINSFITLFSFLEF